MTNDDRLDLVNTEEVELGGVRFLVANVAPETGHVAVELARHASTGCAGVWWRAHHGRAVWVLHCEANDLRAGDVAALFGGGGTETDARFDLPWLAHATLLGAPGDPPSNRPQANWRDLRDLVLPPKHVPEGYTLVGTDEDWTQVEGPGPGRRFIPTKSTLMGAAEMVRAYEAALTRVDPRVVVLERCMESAWEIVRAQPEYTDRSSPVTGYELLPEMISKILEHRQKMAGKPDTESR